VGFARARREVAGAIAAATVATTGVVRTGAGVGFGEGCLGGAGWWWRRKR
jgi:hypothetical protein